MKFLSLLTAAALLASPLFAADIIVSPSGTYPSIQDAVNAAADGDRIVVQNIGGTAAWIGNININKSLDFVSYDNNTPFYVQGNVSITPAANRNINIIGMNIYGDINYNTGSGLTKVSVSDCTVSGSINLSAPSINAFIGGNNITNIVTISYAHVVGNSIGRHISVNNNYTGTTSAPNTIIGNKIGSYIDYSSNIPFRILNNFLNYTYSNGYISISNHSPSAASTSYIENNTIQCQNTYSSFEFYNTSSLATISLQNNVSVHAGSSSSSSKFLYEASTSAATILCNYNYSYPTTNYISINNNNYAAGILYGGNSFNTTTGVLYNGHFGINGGHPLNKYADLDLSRNDAGIFGGSYSYNNFFPIQTGSARTLFVNLSGNTFMQGQTINIQAVGIDR